MLFLLVYSLVLVIIVLAPHYQEIKMWILYLTDQTMYEAFPEFVNWEEGDKIYFAVNSDNDMMAYLSAMTDKYVIVEYNGNTHKVRPYQIKLNESYQTRKTKREVEMFHKEILPSLTDSENKFPQLSGRTKRQKV